MNFRLELLPPINPKKSFLGKMQFLKHHESLEAAMTGVISIMIELKHGPVSVPVDFSVCVHLTFSKPRSGVPPCYRYNG